MTFNPPKSTEAWARLSGFRCEDEEAACLLADAGMDSRVRKKRPMERQNQNEQTRQCCPAHRSLSGRQAGSPPMIMA
jgi:hypothetical protein